MLRETIWQLAHETNVFADWRGFADAALPGDRPAGFLRWCSRMIMSTGLSDGWWWFPYLALALLLGGSAYLVLPRRLMSNSRKWRVAVAASCFLLAALYVIVPVVATGSFVWDETECSFPVMNPLGTLLAIWIFAALRGRSGEGAASPSSSRATVRGSGALAASEQSDTRGIVPRGSGALAASLFCALICALLFVPFGLYPLASLLALLVCQVSRNIRRRGAAACMMCLVSAALAAVCVGVERRHLYDDLSWREAFESSHAVRLRWNPGGPELARQLRMERAVVSCDWNGVMKTAGQGDDVMLRMETAYRILAQYRLERLPDDLFKFPVNSPHTLESEDQRLMDGYLLFFEYGLLQQARCYAMELVSKHSWRPDYYRVLGDTALIQGRTHEARRHYSQLARVPFRRGLAEKRLKCADGGAMPSELAEVAQMAKALDRLAGSTSGLELFRLDNLVERHVYERYGKLREAPDGMMKMHVAALLLDCEIDRLVSESALVDRLYPGHWPVPVQEAVLMHAGRLDQSAQKDYLKGVRPGVVQREVFERMRRFSEARDKLGAKVSQADAERMWREFRGTYPIYEWLVAGCMPDRPRREGERPRGPLGEAAPSPLQSKAPPVASSLGEAAPSPLQTPSPPVLLPDYLGITMPPNIAPLNFRLASGGAGKASMTAKDGSIIETQSRPDGLFAWDAREWRAFLDAHRGEGLEVRISREGCADVVATNMVSRSPIDSHLTYRLIEPSYEHFGEMGIYQRDLETFAERPLYRNVQMDRGQCVNCHTYNRSDPGQYLFHTRAVAGGTHVVSGKWGVRKLDLASVGMFGPGVYPAWHPSGDMIVFSVNETRQCFYASNPDKVEVFDMRSDLMLYSLADDAATPVEASDEWFETFPTWSPDGSRLYSVRAKMPFDVLPQDFKERHELVRRHIHDFRYVLVVRDFDAGSREFSEPRVVYDGGKGRSVTFPRVSPDGRWLVMTVGPYGNFHVWHNAADLCILDLSAIPRGSGALAASDQGSACECPVVRMLDELNSPMSESYHTFSRSGEWMVFSSRRADGSYTRPHFAAFDASTGRFSKPFVLPVEDPECHDRRMLSYNIPEFSVGPVRESPSALRRLVNQ